jgi:hypothetical protein
VEYGVAGPVSFTFMHNYGLLLSQRFFSSFAVVKHPISKLTQRKEKHEEENLREMLAEGNGKGRGGIITYHRS